MSFKNRVLRPAEFIPPVEPFETLRPAYFDAAVAHVVELYSQSGGAMVAGVLLKSLLLEIVMDSRAEKPATSIRRHHQKKLARIISEIRSHPEIGCNVKALATECGYGPDHFTRVFRTITGFAPKEFAVNVRMERARALLRESSHTVTQIADLLGYQDLGFFSRQFKAHFGLSPSEVRRAQIWGSHDDNRLR